MNSITHLPKHAPALVYVSSHRYLYLGRGKLRIRDLHAAAASLVVCLEGSVGFKTPDMNYWSEARSLLIPAGGKIIIDNREAVLCACYLDAGKADFVALKKQMQATSRGIHHRHAKESELIQGFTAIRDEAPAFEEAQRRAEQIIYRHPSASDVRVDARVSQVVERLRATSALNVSVRALAEEVGLSESGLIKLFNQQVGAPLRKHRLWYRLIDFICLTLSGMPTPTALKTAGFSDAAHLSRCYSGFFGVNFSYAFSKHTHVRYITGSQAPDEMLQDSGQA